ncbi:MAG: twin-arginine translocation signal domain-containing protein [Woeseiaceae bacterium]|jgi:arsenite oxidase small subunit
MADSDALSRRRFIKACLGAGAAVAANPSLVAEPRSELAAAQRVALVDQRGEPLEPDALTVGESYIFHYPYVTTPCFLMDLGVAAGPGPKLATADGRSYRWSGGVGPRRSIVAFSAICAHRMSYPTPHVSFIDYRHKPLVEGDPDSGWPARGQVIYCCSEGSVYDARDGGRVLSGPAPQPLAAVELEYSAGEETLFATGTYGGDMFERFFSEFGFQVALAFGREDIQRPASDTATVLPLSEYSKTTAC